MIVGTIASIADSCKVRNVDKQTLSTKIDNVVVKHTDSSGTKTVVSVDTSTNHVKVTTTLKDSSTITTEITPKDGTTTTIDSKGDVTGQFTNIKRTTQKHKALTSTGQEDSKAGKSSNTTEASHTNTADSSHLKMQKDSTSKQTKSDSTVAANFPIKWVLIVLAGVILLGLLVWKFRKFFGL